MAKDFQRLQQLLSQQMVIAARKAGVYDHPSAKGDAREELVRSFLAARVGNTFGVTKAEVVDSCGGTSPEIDAVIYDQSVAACLDVEGQRCVVRIETVAVAVEVRTQLTKQAISEKEPAIAKLHKLVRFFNPAMPLMSLLRTMRDPTPTREMLNAGLPAGKHFNEVPAVTSALFAFEGPDQDTAARYVQEHCFDVICVLGKYTISKELRGSPFYGKPGCALWGEDDDALGAFLIRLEHDLQAFREARQWVWPRATAYYNGM